MKYEYSDGGRAAAGYKGEVGDCVTRAISIATALPYKEVYKALSRPGNTARHGVMRDIYEPYLKSLGWEWVPTMQVGRGCKVHLRADELPSGRLVVRLSKHIVCVKDGVVYDNHDPRRGGKRCVYGYFKPSAVALGSTIHRELEQKLITNKEQTDEG